MKIAIASDNGETVTGHVGRCRQFLVFEVDNGSITGKEIRTNTFTHHMKSGQKEHHEHPHDHAHGHGHHTGGHGDLADAFADCKYLVSKGMGKRLVEDLRSRNIEPIITDIDSPEEAAIKAERGQLVSQENKACH